MIVKSGLEKIFFKFLHAGDYFSLLHKSAQNHKFSNKNNCLPAWRDFKTNFSRPLFTIIFRSKIRVIKNGIFGYRFHFEGKTNAWISKVRRVKIDGTRNKDFLSSRTLFSLLLSYLAFHVRFVFDQKKCLFSFRVQDLHLRSVGYKNWSP